MTILQHWLNGRSIEWIAARKEVSVKVVQDEIKMKWEAL